LLVALAAPAVNVSLAALLAGVVTPTAWHDVQWVGGDFLSNLLWVNVSLAVFNLIPAFPMDGGRALRALLAMRMDDVRATQIAAHIGSGAGAGVRPHRPVQQSVPRVHRVVRVDGRRLRGERRAHAIRPGWHSGEPP
jgi:Zn-dependent protease